MGLTSPSRIAGVTFGNPLMNGAYINSKTVEDVEKLAASSSGAIVVGSISVEPRTQNTGQGYWKHREKFYSLNSYGMPNGGFEYFKAMLPRMVKLAHSKSKPLIANIIGFSSEEFVQLAALADKSNADIVELNFGCPNVWDKNGKQKLIPSYHPAVMEDILSHIRVAKPSIKIAAKLSPLPPDILAQAAEVLARSKIVSFVTATNSYPNALTSTGTKRKDEQVLAGLTGRSLKPISLGVTAQLRNLLPSHIELIGCGGIYSANDVFDYFNAGAKAVQIATALVDEGNSVFSKIQFQAANLSP